MTFQIILTIAFIAGVPLLAAVIWYRNRTRDDLTDVPHKWDA